jgi:hypothetical protein
MALMNNFADPKPGKVPPQYVLMEGFWRVRSWCNFVHSQLDVARFVAGRRSDSGAPGSQPAERHGSEM